MSGSRQKCRIFSLLMKKNFLVRRRSWISAFVFLIIMPASVLLFAQHLKTELSKSSSTAQNNSYVLEYGSCGTEICNDINIVFTPNDPFNEQIMDYTKHCLGIQNYSQVQGFNSEDEAIQTSSNMRNSLNPMTLTEYFIVAFDTNSLSKNFKYVIRTMNHDLSEDLFSEHQNFGNDDSVEDPRIRLQYCLDWAFINQTVQKQSTPSRFLLLQTPHSKDENTEMLLLWALFFAFLFPLFFEDNLVSSEKSVGIDVLMEINGISKCENLSSWWISGVLFPIFYVMPIAAILVKCQYISDVGPFIPESNVFIVWLVLLVHAVHLLSFGMHVASYFTRPILGKLAMLVFYIGSTVFFNHYIELRLALPYIGIVFPNLLLERAFKTIYRHEKTQTRIDWNDVFDFQNQKLPITESVGITIILALLGIIAHFIMAVYVQEIKPGRYGFGKHPLYFLNCFRAKMSSFTTIDGIDYVSLEGKPFEPPRDNQFPGIQIRNLNKFYSGGIFSRALKDISVDFYKNEITTLFGYNGAGKTSMMSILSGRTSAYDGKVLIHGKNIKGAFNEIRNHVGVCPQENIFFPDLNVYEHLVFFGMLKRNNKKKISDYADTLLQKLYLSEKRNSLPEKLSGRQKRQLSLCMALIGGSKVLILDEPTSGLDQRSKRDVWNVLLELKGETMILMSTHDMEEAKVLGDRIAILHSGSLKCNGSPAFLKSFYELQGDVKITFSTLPYCNTKVLLHVLTAKEKFLENGDSSLELNLPISPNLPDALDYIEKHKVELGVWEMNVSRVPLEQIFLKVARDAKDSEEDSFVPWTDSSMKLTGGKLAVQRMNALFAKKLSFTIRNLRFLLAMMVVPLIGVLLTSKVIFPSTSKESSMSSDHPHSQILFVSGKNETNRIRLDIIIKSYDPSILDAGTSFSIAAMFRATADVPKSINLLTDSLLRALTNDSSSIELPNWQKLQPKMNSTDHLYQLIRTCLIFFSIGFFVMHPQMEWTSGIKHLQFMSGVTPMTYWTTMFLFDFSIACIIAVLLSPCMFFLGIIPEFAGILSFIALFLLFAANALPILYVMSSTNKAMVSVMTFMILVPLYLYVFEGIAIQLHEKNVIDKIPLYVLQVILNVMPHVSFYDGYTSIFSVANYHASCTGDQNLSCLLEFSCSDGGSEKLFFESSSEAHHTLQENMMWLCITFFFHVGILMISEYKVISKLFTKTWNRKIESAIDDIDEQITNEKRAVVAGIHKIRNEILDFGVELDDLEHNKNVFLAYELSKKYNKVSAVKEVNFRARERECLGFLGVNGAGKSTILSMLAGEENPDTGSMFMNGRNYQSNRRACLSQMGYYPQDSRIMESLNAKDHLKLFARLRGIPGDRIDREVYYWIDKMNLKAYAAQPLEILSASNKTRLNIAIAMIGNPDLVLLDDPTARVDPVTKKFLWNVITCSRKNGQSVIIASHSMEECEALCNRIAVMVKGKLACIGTIEQLKERIEAGFEIVIKLRRNQNMHSEMTNLMTDMKRFSTQLMNENFGYLTYIEDRLWTWRTMYDTMSFIKKHHPCVESYSITSATLKQLFSKYMNNADI